MQIRHSRGRRGSYQPRRPGRPGRRRRAFRVHGRRLLRLGRRQKRLLIKIAIALAILATIFALAWPRIHRMIYPPEVPSAGVPDVTWRYIVIHHSASEKDNAALIDEAHRKRGWNGLGYHFVIDNGNGGPDGHVEVGYRWKQQIPGAHTGHTPGNEYNAHGIGICLVGNFTNHLPSSVQLQALDDLVFSLADKYHIPPQNIIGHRDAPGAHTECPGEMLHAYLVDTLRPAFERHSRGR